MNKIIDMPKAARKIIEILNENGYDAYIVGGCVRDSLLGKKPNDWDITTSALPLEVKNIFHKTVDTGLKHGTVTVLMDHDQYEVTTFRIDGDYLDGRHPDSVSFTGLLSEDLKRRDFTINAMAYHPNEGVVDLFGGEEDLKNGVIRCVGNPEHRFSEDALRMMRAIRFSAQLGFEIDEDTYNAICKLSDTLAKISSERIRDEMVKLLVSDNPMKFKLFYDTGLTKVFLPEFDKLMLTKQNHIHHIYDVGEHTLHSIDNIRNDKTLRLAMLFHDIGKPLTLSLDEEGVTHFYGHPAKSANMLEEIMGRLNFDNETINLAKALVFNHDRNVECNCRSVRKAINALGIDVFPLLMEVKRADVYAQSDYMRKEKLAIIEELLTLYNEIKERGEPVTTKQLAVSGKDLIEKGLKQGPEIGDILSKMLEDVLEEPSHNNKEYLLSEYVK